MMRDKQVFNQERYVLVLVLQRLPQLPFDEGYPAVTQSGHCS
jgi:hypothetical protein